jgi:hypothetical protein
VARSDIFSHCVMLDVIAGHDLSPSAFAIVNFPFAGKIMQERLPELCASFPIGQIIVDLSSIGDAKAVHACCMILAVLFQPDNSVVKFITDGKRRNPRLARRVKMRFHRLCLPVGVSRTDQEITIRSDRIGFRDTSARFQAGFDGN